MFANENQKLLEIPTAESLHRVIKRLKALGSELDLLLLTGDLSNDGTPESYERLQNLLNLLQIPSYWLPGDRDCVSIIEQVLNLGLVSKRKSFERGGWNFVLLNSTIPGCAHGYLSAETLDWLDSRLKIGTKQPTLVALHHPPFGINSDWIDANILRNAEEFFAVLDRHPQVKLVLFGHVHQEFNGLRNNVRYLGTPSTCVQFKPKSSILTIDKKLPGFRLLKLYPNGTWETWIERVPYFPTSVPPFTSAGLTMSI